LGALKTKKPAGWWRGAFSVAYVDRRDIEGMLQKAYAARFARLLHRACHPFHDVLVSPPKVARTEVEILSADRVHEVLRAAKGMPIYLNLVFGLTLGVRRGETLALRWRDVDFDKGVVRVEYSVEETEGGRTLRFKEPKSAKGRRNITVPPSVSAELRAHWTAQQQTRLALGQGKASPDDLVFPDDKGGARKPSLVTSAWRRLVRIKKLPKVSLHAWRHTHVSQLIASGMDILTISHRIGHSNPSITLDRYGHLFANTDAQAAVVMENAFA
jgi:integrase